MERSADDRERARAERAARRAGTVARLCKDPGPTRSASPPPPPPRRVPASRRPAPRRPPRQRHRHWGRRILAVLALAAIGFALYAINATFQPFHGDPGGPVRVKIPAGADAGQIGDILEAKGVVDSSRWFVLNATVTGRRGGMRPGSYTLQKGMSNGAAIDALTKGPKVKVVPTTNVTIPEGPSIREEAAKIDKASFTGSYTKARATRPRRCARSASSAPRRAPRRPRASCSRPPTRCSRGRRSRTSSPSSSPPSRTTSAASNLAYARKKNLTRYDVLIIASMVEREAQLDKERPLIASVIYNRLKRRHAAGDRRHDPLPHRQLDATDPPVSELDDDNPYNSRLRRGLPPTPIGNPGLKSMKAAAEPARSEVPVLRAQARQVRRARVLLHRRAVRARQRALSGIPALIYLGVCGWPVAHSRSPQMHNAALAAVRPGRLALPAPAAAAGAVRGDRACAAGGRLPRRQRDDPAQAGGAGGRRPGVRGGARRSARRTR